MTRPAEGEWSVLDEDDDPVPGDPDTLVTLRNAYRELAMVTQEAFRLLNGGGEIEGGIGKAMDAYRKLYGEVPKRLDGMANAYSQAADAYSRYMPVLDEAQSMSLTALEQARRAVQDKSAADAMVAALGSATATQDPAAAAQARDDREAAESRQSEASQELDRAKSLLGQAMAMRDQAAAVASEVLRDMADLAPQRSIWEKIGDAFKEFFDFLVDVVAEWLTLALDVLATIAGFIFPPLGWALGALSSGIEILTAVLKDDMVALGIALGGLALSFVPGGKIIKNVVKYGSKAVGTVKSGVGALAKNVGAGGGRNVDVSIPAPRNGADVPKVGVTARGINTPPRKNAQPTIDKIVCGDPIDVASGRMMLPQTDVELVGVLSLVFTRTHLSSYRIGGWFGPTWASTVDQRLEVDQRGITFVVEDGTILAYPDPGDDVAMPDEGPRWPITRMTGGGYCVLQPQQHRALHFAPGKGVVPISAVVDMAGNRIDFAYDEHGTITRISHSGGSWLDVRTETGRVTELAVVDRDGVRTSIARYEYQQGNLVKVIGPSGAATTFRYGAHDRIVRWEDSNGMWYEYIYDAEDRCVRTRGADGFLNYRLQYGENVTHVTDSLGHTTTYELNDAFQVVRQTGPLGGVVESAWDRYDRLLARTDELGNTTRYSYDAAGNLAGTTASDGQETVAEYALPERPTRRVLADGTEWHFEYDSDGRLVTEIDPTGARTAYKYDGNTVTKTDPAGGRTSTEYNAAGLPARVIDPLGAVTRYEYDALGRATAMVDSLGGVTRMGWDAAGHLIAMQRPDGAREQREYDGEGNLVRSVTAQGELASAEYGYFDLPLQAVIPASGRVNFSYDTELRLTGVTNERGVQWRYEYDAAGNLVREIDFDGREQRYTTDAAGRIVEWENSSGQNVRLTWDACGRLTQRQTDQGTTTFQYDAAGRLTRATGPDGDVARTYDRMGRLLTETVNGRTLHNQYDLAGRRISRTTPSGAESAWEYDAGNRPVTLHASGRTIKFGYDSLGQETSREFGPVRLIQEWDAGQRLRSQSLDNGAQHRTYTYRADGTLTTVEDQLSGDREYEVDGPGRVTAVRGSAVVEHYGYDSAGLLTESVHGEHEYNGMQLRRVGDLKYEHDADGRMVQRREGDRVWRFRWNALDQLIAVITPDGEHWRYRYDPLGRRIAKQRTTPDGTTVLDRVEFTWDETELAEQTHRDTVTVWDWRPGQPQPISQVERTGSQDWVDARFRAMITDLTGTPSELLDENGTITWHADHTLWGLGFTSADGTPLRFPGQYHDPETGLHYNVHRYYDPATGRYTSKDPLGLAPATDPRAYVLNPTGWIDPLGLAPCQPNSNGWNQFGSDQNTFNNQETWNQFASSAGIPTPNHGTVTGNQYGQTPLQHNPQNAGGWPPVGAHHITDIRPISPGSTNDTHLVSFDDGTQGIYKPASGEHHSQRVGIPGNLAGREVSAYQVDALLGFGKVPQTTMMHGPYGEGSVQRFIHSSAGASDHMQYSAYDREQMAILDYVIGNTDRHRGNYRTDGHGRVFAIDHGYTFPEFPDPQAGIRSDFTFYQLNTPLSQDATAKVAAVDPLAVRHTLEVNGMSETAIQGTLARLDEIKRWGMITGEQWPGTIRDFWDAMPYRYYNSQQASSSSGNSSSLWNSSRWQSSNNPSAGSQQFGNQ